MLTPTAGTTIKAARERRNLTQQELGTQANVSLWTICDIETGRNTTPRVGTVHAIADVLGLDAAALFDPEQASA